MNAIISFVDDLNRIQFRQMTQLNKGKNDKQSEDKIKEYTSSNATDNQDEESGE